MHVIPVLGMEQNSALCGCYASFRAWSQPLKATGTSAFAKSDEVTAQTARFTRRYISLLFGFEEQGLL